MEENKKSGERQAAENLSAPAEPEAKAAAAQAETDTQQPAAQEMACGGEGADALKEKVVEAVRTCYDPEIPVNIYELGLIYDIIINPASEVTVKMTLTSPACPAAMSLPGEVEDKIRVTAKPKDVKVEVVWDPPWTPDMMSEAARLQLGMM
jgi:FeS assembly SUF system protein